MRNAKKIGGWLATGFLVAVCATVAESADFARPKFGFIAHAPDEWKVFGEREGQEMLLLDFGLPEVWSDLEKQQIENSVYIMADRNAGSIEGMIAFDKDRLKDIVESREAAASKQGKAFIVISKIDGLEYKTMTTYRFENGIGYIVGFTATHGTFEKNLPKYHAFLEQLEFTAPPTPAKE